MTKSRTSKSARTASPTAGDARPSGMLIVLTVALLVARFLLPTEASVDGETLWLTQCTFGLGMVWVWDRFAARQPLIRWDGLTIAMLLLVAGHVISGVAVLSRGGDKRAAVNMMWEWGALGVMFLAVRTVLQHPLGPRRLQWTLMAVVVSLAGLGLYQHYIWLPDRAAEYTETRTELDRRESATSFRTVGEYEFNRRRIFELKRNLTRQGVSVDGPARRQWEDRLTSSREPFGTFGLANTFAGLLIAFLFPAAALLADGIRRREKWTALIGPAVAVALLTWCLVLTKSRTAWVGCVVGAFTWWWFEGRNSDVVRRWFVRGVAAAAGIAMLVTAITISGGLDREVVSEAPKSLRYRLQYWTGTIGVVKEFPVLGSGPGNFRSHYLKYKLPESSEEIRDPHNLVFDVWCSGGLVGVTGLFFLLGCTFRVAVGQGRRSGECVDAEDASTSRGDISSRPTAWILGMTGGFLLVSILMFLHAEDDLLERNFGLFFGTLAALWGIRLVNRLGLTRASLTAALIALAVHLCGAGGIEMPAITQGLLVLCLAGGAPARGARIGTQTVALRDEERPSLGRVAVFLFGSGVFAVMFGACLTTAALPHALRTTLLSQSDSLLLEQGATTEAERALRAAVEADPFSAEPLRRLSDVYQLRWQRPGGALQLLIRAIELRRLAIDRDPYHYVDHWRLGDALSDEYAITRAPETLNDAVAAFEQAITRNPHNALLLAHYAEALHNGKRKTAAADIAARAIAQDDINRKENHRDKFLADNVRENLISIRDGRAVEPEQPPKRSLKGRGNHE